jgi:cytochrome c biogenesis protein CcdA
MVGTIGPIVYGRAALEKYVLLGIYTAAHVLGALATGTVVVSIGRMIPGPLHARGSTIFAASCLLLSLHEWRFIRLPLPEFRRQVPKRWRRWSGLGAFLYGGVLGAAIGTRITAAAYYAFLLGVVLNGQLGCGAIAMTTFGLARALPVCILAAMQFQNAAKFLTSLMNVREVMHVANGSVLLFVGLLWEAWVRLR